MHELPPDLPNDLRQSLLGNEKNLENLNLIADLVPKLHFRNINLAIVVEHWHKVKLSMEDPTFTNYSHYFGNTCLKKQISLHDSI